MEGIRCASREVIYFHAEYAEFAEPAGRKSFVALRFIKFGGFCVIKSEDLSNDHLLHHSAFFPVGHKEIEAIPTTQVILHCR